MCWRYVGGTSANMLARMLAACWPACCFGGVRFVTLSGCKTFQNNLKGSVENNKL